MNVLLLRYPWSMLRGMRNARVDWRDETVLNLRVRWTDLDWYGHMNNGRYLTNMDLGRIDWAARTGLVSAFRARGWKPVMAGATIRYRRSLDALRGYRLRTRLVGWDDDWFFFEQHFERAGKAAAKAYAKVAILSGSSRVAPDRVMHAVGWNGERPQLPESIVVWQRSDAS